MDILSAVSQTRQDNMHHSPLRVEDEDAAGNGAYVVQVHR